MGSEINLDIIVLNQMSNYGKSEYKNLLSVMREDIVDKFGYLDSKSFDKADQVNNVALKYSAINLASSSELTSKLSLYNGSGKELANLLSAYIAAQAVIQINHKQEPTDSLENKLIPRSSPTFDRLNFSSGDKTILGQILKSYHGYMKVGSSSADIISESNYFFFQLSDLIRNNLSRNKYSKQKSFLEELIVQGPGFQVNGIRASKKKSKKTAQFSNGEEQFKKDFKEIKLIGSKKVYSRNIIGNQEAVYEVGEAVKDLLAYRIKEKENPFVQGRKNYGFEQGLLLMGGPGTGKTMTAFYGMTLADKIAKSYAKDLKIVKFDIESSFQDGGIQMMRNQLESICRGDEIYLVFIDEIDTVISSRSGEDKSNFNQKQKLGELMRFIEGDYPNLGNYLIIATTNDTGNVDTALKNGRLKRIYCPGPITAKEKVGVLVANFSDDIENGLVKVNNWVEIGNLAYQYQLDGRVLRDVVKACYKESRQISNKDRIEIYSAATLNGARKIIKSNFQPINDEMILNKIEYFAKKDIDEIMAIQDFHNG